VCPSIERESEESPSIDSHSRSYTTEALSEVMKEESPSATHHRIAILQGRHRSEMRGITLGTRCQLCRVEQLRGVCGAVLFSARSIALIGAQILKRSNYSKGEGSQMVFHPTYTKQFG
jgi:hypothetical protein